MRFDNSNPNKNPKRYTGRNALINFSEIPFLPCEEELSLHLSYVMGCKEHFEKLPLWYSNLPLVSNIT